MVGSRRLKYGNNRVRVDGQLFDSVGEYEHWKHLREREAAGEISDLRRQVAFELAPSLVVWGRKKPALRYIADYVYMENGERVVADYKGGPLTPLFRAKAHLLKAVHGIDILIVRGRTDRRGRGGNEANNS
jgi:hypothetical protein